MDKRTICLLNDSFPPEIDGVANAVVNYAKNITKSGETPLSSRRQCPARTTARSHSPCCAT